MLTVGELKELLANRPDDQPVLIQLNGNNGFSVEDDIRPTEKALWLTRDAQPYREMQLYLEIELPEYLRNV